MWKTIQNSFTGKPKETISIELYQAVEKQFKKTFLEMMPNPSVVWTRSQNGHTRLVALCMSPLSLSLSHPEPVISLGCPKKNLKNKNSCRWQQQWIDFTWLSNANQLPVVYPEISVTLTSQCCRHWYWTVSNDTQPYSDGHILYCQAWLKKKIIYILLIFKQHLHHAKLYLLI